MITKGYWNDVIHDRLYFGDNDGGASVINATEFRIFIAEVGAATANISTGAAVTQTEADTSLEGQGGTIPNGEWFVINAIGINIRVSNWQATEPFTNNAVTSINITPVARVTPIPLYDALIEQCTFELYRNTNDLLEKGNIGEYPCEFGVNGFAGGSGASVPALLSRAFSSTILSLDGLLLSRATKSLVGHCGHSEGPQRKRRSLRSSRRHFALNQNSV